MKIKKFDGAKHTPASASWRDAMTGEAGLELVEPASFHDSQIFRQDDDGTGKPRYFSIGPMVKFARENLPVECVRGDPTRAAGMLRRGAVDAGYVLELTKKERLPPIILCLGDKDEVGDFIVDGNHRYVAWTLAMHEREMEIAVPAYRLKPREWARFIIPHDVVMMMGLTNPSGTEPGKSV